MKNESSPAPPSANADPAALRLDMSEIFFTIETPIITLTKRDIVLKGLDLEAPFDRTWSCYQSEDEAIQNLRCD